MPMDHCLGQQHADIVSAVVQQELRDLPVGWLCHPLPKQSGQQQHSDQPLKGRLFHVLTEGKKVYPHYSTGA